jgi:hypothetical protein
MSNHVYYGEYSLAYWIELILTRKIVLPKYQRHFVWNKDSLKTLINTFQDNRFVPPVTIGAFCKSDGSITNYIIDGQQRLTSILLAYLDLFPDKEKYKTHLLALARGEESIDEDEGDPYDNVLEWNLSYLTEKGNNKNEICSKLEEGNYMSIGLELPNQFFHEHYLGFSYIVPDADETSQQCYYTKMFRDINVQGVQLIDIESRRSLYFLNERYEDFFEPAFVANYYVNRVGEKQQLDFTRYLCLLSAFKKSNNENRVARGFSGKRIEKYIEMYIYSVVGNDNEDIFGRFSDIFPGSDFAEDIQCLKSTLENLNLPKEYPSIINMDMYFFGLIYHVLLCHRHIDISRKGQLKNRIERRINDLRDMDNHAQAPAQFQYMRQRLIQSIDIYESFVLS